MSCEPYHDQFQLLRDVDYGRFSAITCQGEHAKWHSLYLPGSTINATNITFTLQTPNMTHTWRTSEHEIETIVAYDAATFNDEGTSGPVPSRGVCPASESLTSGGLRTNEYSLNTQISAGIAVPHFSRILLASLLLLSIAAVVTA